MEGQQKFQDSGCVTWNKVIYIYHYLTTFWERFLLHNRILKVIFIYTFFLLNSARIWIRET